jgi:Fe-S cluster biogenesis protein NfuA
MVNSEHEKKVMKALEKVRPYLQADGGDINIVEITPDLVVKVEMTGSCNNCPFSLHTLKAGVEEAIRKELPDVKEVIAVNI